MPDKPRVLIAGAGIGGLTAALALLQRGFDVDVFEQAEELRELGAGIQLGPNGSRILIALGLGAAMREVVAEPAAKEVRLWSTGETWTLFDLSRDSLERFGAPYWMVHRGDFHRVLWQAVERAKPGAIHLGSRCVACADRDDGAAARARGRPAHCRRPRGRRRRRALAPARAPVRRRQAAVHRPDGLARHRADGAAAGRAAPPRRQQLARTRRPRRHLSAAARRRCSTSSAWSSATTG